MKLSEKTMTFSEMGPRDRKMSNLYCPIRKLVVTITEYYDPNKHLAKMGLRNHPTHSCDLREETETKVEETFNKKNTKKFVDV